MAPPAKRLRTTPPPALRVRIEPYHEGPAVELTLDPGTTISELKRQVRVAHVMMPDDRVRLYTTKTMDMEYKDEFTLCAYGFQSGRTMVLAPVCMADVPVPVTDFQGAAMPFVKPPDAVGHYAPCGHVILAYDYDKAEFVLQGGDTITVNKLVFDGGLRSPEWDLGHDGLGPYGQCMIGEVKVLDVTASHVLVRNAESRTLAMLPQAVQSLREEFVLHDLRVVYNKTDGMHFRKLPVTGGLMSVVDRVLQHLLVKRGLQAVGPVRVRRIGGLALTETLDRLPRLTGLVLKLETRFERVKSIYPKLTSAKSIIAHSLLLSELDRSPWLLPRKPAALMALVFANDQTVPPFDATQLRMPYEMDKDGNIVIARSMPDSVVQEQAAEAVPPDDFVAQVRSGSIRPYKDGTYLHCYSRRKVACAEDLHAKHFELEALYDEILPLGSWDINTLIVQCPKAWLRETFGSAYDASTGTLTFR